MKFIERAVIVIVCILGLVSGQMLYWNFLSPSRPQPNLEVKPTTSLEISQEHLLELNINKLPDGDLKNSMTIVLASEYAGVGSELNEMLRAYAKMQVDLLTRKNEL